MSQASNASAISVGLNGQAVGLEQAIDATCRGLEMHLNRVQLHLRHIASVVEQDDDYETELKLSADLDDDLREMSWLFDDLRQMAADMISLPEGPEEKAFLKKWKIDRKELERRLQTEHAAKVKAERTSAKLALAMAKSSIAEGDEDAEMGH